MLKTKLKTESFFEYSIYSDSLNEIFIKKNKIVNTINPHSYCVALDDPKFKDALVNSDVLVADGHGISLAMKIKKKVNIPVITGSDLHRKALALSEQNSLKIFYLGSSLKCLNAIELKIRKNHPNIKVRTLSPPFKKEFSQEDSLTMIEEINSFSPDFLFVGMTAPKQEKWVHNYHHELKVKWICSIGAVFDYYSENIRRAPLWARKVGMEWVYRSFTSLRLAKRNLISNPRFILNIIRER